MSLVKVVSMCLMGSSDVGVGHEKHLGIFLTRLQKLN